MKHIFSTIALIIIIGIIGIVIFIEGLDIGDYVQECAEGQIIRNVNGKWSCSNETIGLNSSDIKTANKVIYDITSSKKKVVQWDIRDADENVVIIKTDPQKIIIYGDKIE